MREIIGKTLFVALILVGCTAWFAYANPLHVQAGNGLPLSIGLNQFTVGAIAAQQVTLPAFDQVGVVFIDTATSPAVPYLAYETVTKGKSRLMTRVLLFDQNGPGGRGCQVSAGELPCVRSITGADNFASDISPIPSGTVAHIKGGLSDQAVVVTGYDTGGASLPLHMAHFSAAVGDELSISNGLVLQLNSVQDDARCILGVGCFGNGTKRLEVTLTQGKAITKTYLVPGTVFSYGNLNILLLTLTGNSTTARNDANFLVARTGK